MDLVRALGADEVVDYTKGDFTRTAERYDIVLDTGGNRALGDLRRLLSPGGTLVLIGGEGGNRVLVQPVDAPGVITFTAHLRKGGNLFRGGKLRWFVENEGGYSQYELDKKKFTAKIPGGSHSRDLGKGSAAEEDEEGKAYTVQIEITPDRIIHRMKVGSSWETVDTQANRGGATEGRFGFVIPGGDEIAISGYRFTPRQ